MALATMQGSDRRMAQANTIQLNGRSCAVMRYAQIRSTEQDAHPVTEYCSWRQIAKLLVNSASFRQLWTRTLATPNALAACSDYQWKPLPIHPCSANSPFFAVLVPTRFATANPTAYLSHFAALPPDRRVAVFPNLSGGSVLVSPAPQPQTEHQRFGHLADFCDTASSELTEEFWRCIGTLALDRLDTGESAWCNTHGHGVPWLHVRFDASHKYASFPPYGAINSTSQHKWYAIYEQTFGDRITLQSHP